MRPIRLISYLLLPRSGQTGARPMRGRAHIRVENDVVSLSTPPQRPPSSPVRDARPSEPNGVQTEAVDEIEMPLQSNPQTFFLGSLVTLAVLAAVYVASSIILPVVLAFILQLLLQPAVRLLERVHLPRALGALLAILLVVGSIVGLVAALSVPARTWAERLPEGIPRLESHFVVLKGPIQIFQKAIQQAEQVTDDPGKQGTTIAVRRDLGLTGALFVQSLTACLRRFWCSIFSWCQAKSPFDAWSRSYRTSATSGKPATFLNRSRQTYPHIWRRSPP
jgi:hypothetical protein